MRSSRSTFALLVLLLGLSMIGSWFVVGTPSRAQDDQGVLANVLSRLLTTPAARIEIGAIEGALSTNAVIRNIRVADEDGVWLTLDRADLDWSLTALLRGRLQVRELTLGELRIARRPLPTDRPEQVAEGPLFPEVPVEVIIDKFALERLVLEEPVLGTAAEVSATGSARLGSPAEGLQLDFEARRLDAEGTLNVGLRYVPETNVLSLNLVHDEPAGGIVARLLDLPGLPPVQLQVSGEAPLSEFAAQLTFQAGPTIGAQGRATIDRVANAYRLNLDLAAQIAGILPEAVAPIFVGTTQLSGNVAVMDDGSVQLEQLRLASAVAEVELTGTVGADRELDLRLTGTAVPAPDGVTRAGAAQIGDLDLNLTVQGPLTAPRIAGLVTATDLRLPEGAVQSLRAEISSAPEGDETPAARFDFTIDAEATGVALADAALATAVGDRIRVVARGTADLAGIADVAQARIETPTMNASYAGLVAARTVDGTLEANIPSLAPFSDLANMRLQGAATITARLTGDPFADDVTAVLQGSLTNFATGRTALDGLFGPEVTLAGTARRVPGGFALDGLRLDGANLDLTIDGTATDETADLTLNADIPRLAELHERVDAGRARIEARLTGSLETPNVAANVTLEDVRAMDRPIPRMVVGLQATDITGALNAALTLEGQVGPNPASGTLRLRAVDQGYALDQLDVNIGSVAITGDLRIGPELLTEGQIAVRAGNLDDLSPLLLTRLGGSIEANVRLDVRDGAQDAVIQASGAQLRYEDITLQDFRVDATARDIFRAPRVDGVAEAGTLTFAGQTFTAVRLAAQGTAEATNFTISATGQGFVFETTGQLLPGEPLPRLELQDFSARRAGRTLDLIAPVTIQFADGAVTISPLTLAADGGRITLAGTIGDTLDLSLDVTALPLAVAEVFVPDLGISGTATGSARIGGTPAAPTGPYQIRLADLSLPQLRDAGLQPLTVAAEGQLQGDRATLEASVEAGIFGTLRVAGSVPLDPAGTLALTTTGRIDLAAANVFLGEGRRLTGAAAVDLTIGGTLADPAIGGAATLQNATFADELIGFRLAGINARLVGDGNLLRIETFTAVTANNGTLAASGDIRIDPQADFPANLRIVGTRAQLADNPTATAVANLDVTISGPLLTSPLVQGRIDFLTLDVTVPDRLPTTLQPLPGTRHVDPPPTAQARLALAAQRVRATQEQRVFDARLDLTIVALNRIFVRGRGINAELGGELQLTGTTRDPVAIGAFDLRRGRFDILGRRLNFTRGRLAFTGDLVPELDFAAEVQAADVTARIIVSGPAGNPTFDFESEPDLPQDEVLSRILFGQASGALTASQALQLAQAVASLAGGGPGAFDALRRGLGVDSLDITVGTGGPAIGIGRYISDNIRVGVRAGARPDETGVTVDIDLTRRIRAQAEVGADGRSAVGIGMEWEW